MELFVNLTKRFPFYSSKPNTSGPSLTRPEFPPTDYETIDLTEPRKRPKSRSADAAPMRGKITSDYTPVRRAFEESEKA